MVQKVMQSVIKMKIVQGADLQSNIMPPVSEYNTTEAGLISRYQTYLLPESCNRLKSRIKFKSLFDIL